MANTPQRNVLITGASRGIGAAAARMLAGRGWSVAVNYARNRDAADAVAKDVEAAGGRACVVGGDVAVEAEVIAMFDAAEAALGKLDAVVVNAGVLGLAHALADMETDRIRRTIDVNVFGALLTAREGARRLSKSRGGRGGSIVILSSAAARLGGANQAVDYAATKGAMDVMTIGLSQELGPEGVRVNAIRPGLIETDIQNDTGIENRAWSLADRIPLRRPGSAEETAEAIAWLLSDAASYVAGAILDVGGGR